MTHRKPVPPSEPKTLMEVFFPEDFPPIERLTITVAPHHDQPAAPKTLMEVLAPYLDEDGDRINWDAVRAAEDREA